MYTKKRRGPRTVPCGTPEVTGDDDEVFPLSTTCWLLSARNPRQGLVANAVMVQLCCKPLMGDLVECLTKVNQDGIYVLFVVQASSEIMDG